MDDETSDRRQGIVEAVNNSVDLGNQGICEEDSRKNQNVPETVIVIRSIEEAPENRNNNNNNSCNANGNSSETVNVLVGERKTKQDSKDDDDKNNSCVIDVKSGTGDGKILGENLDGERVCRICHLCSDPSVETPASPITATISMMTAAPPSGLIQLGCGCKDELGSAHGHCAEAWFKLKGNRQCEICGEIAKNIADVGDNRFIEEWNESRPTGNGNVSGRRGGCWRGQPFCNFLMACLVIAFVLPWFFRVNMF